MHLLLDNASVKYYDWYTNQSTHKLTQSKDTSFIFTKKGYNYIYVDMYDKYAGYLGYAAAAVLVDEYNSLNVQTNKVCPTQPITFSINTNSDSYEANFGDGTKITSTSYFTHSYSNIGVYTYSVKFTGKCGHDTTLQQQIMVLDNIPWNSNMKIYKGKSISCPNEQISFSINADYSKAEWTFGDGDKVLGNYIDHTFKSVGKYYVTVKVTSYCGRDTLIKDSIQIKGNLPITATNSIYVSDNVCPNKSVSFGYYGIRIIL